MKKAVLTIFLLIGITPAAYADCIFDGKSYQTGEKIGGFECQADGTWKPLNPGVKVTAEQRAH